MRTGFNYKMTILKAVIFPQCRKQSTRDGNVHLMADELLKEDVAMFRDLILITPELGLLPKLIRVASIFVSESDSCIYESSLTD